MASQSLIVTLLLTLFLFHHATADDEALINKLCGATYAPAACVSCVKHGPPVATTTVTLNDITTEVDVLDRLLSCGEDDIQKLEKAIVQIIDGEGDEATKKMLSDCQPAITSAIHNGAFLRTDVAGEQYNAAKNEINTGIMEMLDMCNDVMKSAGITIPPPVFSGMFAVEADYKMTYQVLQTLQPPVSYKVTKN